MLEFRSNLSADDIAPVAQGNPGAVGLVTNLVNVYGREHPVFGHIEDMNMTGSRLWHGFVLCNRDLKTFVAKVSTRDRKLVEDINQAFPNSETASQVVVRGGAPYIPRDGSKRFVVSLSDNDLSQCAIGNKSKFRDLIIFDKAQISKSAVRSVVQRLARLDPEFGKKGHGFASALKEAAIYFNKDQIQAAKVVIDAHMRFKKYKNLAIIRDFSFQLCRTPKETLICALKVLNAEFGRRVDIVGVKVGTWHEEWNQLRTPVCISRDGKWMEETTATEKPYGQIVDYFPGIKLGELVEVERKRGLLVQASHHHNGLGAGTSRFRVRFEDGREKLIVPWLVSKAPWLNPH